MVVARDAIDRIIRTSVRFTKKAGRLKKPVSRTQMDRQHANSGSNDWDAKSGISEMARGVLDGGERQQDTGGIGTLQPDRRARVQGCPAKRWDLLIWSVQTLAPRNREVLVREGVPEQDGDEGGEVALSQDNWSYWNAWQPRRQLISTRAVWGFFGDFWLLSGIHAWWGKQKISSRQVSIGNTPVADRRKSNNKMSGNSGVYECVQKDDESDGDWMRRSAATAIVGAFQ
jgi:hypothetical protein